MDESATQGYENPNEFCYDTVPTHTYFYANQAGSALLGYRVITDFDEMRDLHQVYALSDYSDQLTCSGSSPASGALAKLASFLPQSPENMRIPNIIASMAQEGTLASQVAIELYSGVWQFLGLLTFFKMVKAFKP